MYVKVTLIQRVVLLQHHHESRRPFGLHFTDIVTSNLDNAMFHNKAYVAAKLSNGGYFAQGGRTSNIYPGENTTYTFENGTSVTVDNVALLRYDFTGASNNYYFMNRYAGNHRNYNPIAIPFDSPGYPTAIVATKDGTLGGYYLQGSGYEDVAVLTVLSFAPESVVEYQAVAETFLADAVKDGKKRLETFTD